jgi:hypothetical protein
MKHLLRKRFLLRLSVVLAFVTVVGCSGQPPASTSQEQQAKEHEAQEKLKAAMQTDPTLKPPGSQTTPMGANVSPGPVPGAGGMSPGPVPGR